MDEDRGCQHGEDEDCMICRVCGKCREDLDSDDLCMDCGGVDENLSDWVPENDEVPNESKALKIARKYIMENKIDTDLNWSEEAGEFFSIQNIASLQQGKGNIRQFLKDIRKAGYEIYLDHPRREALPFWIKMYNEGLIDENPEYNNLWPEE